ncbi:hypothetical protein H072_6674 [Dactylellina haptotyla CBS 200.50]|uniref:C2H2-type domain-containing protein n=1 Tax=Dactylellina haptotyla (strain CBS 200.50) TaxID=1284197 RepID=S8AEL8_DACHA|nr:hypothetical protein H072_6674 [Dactylellina haptotyla CBS 200.50]
MRRKTISDETDEPRFEFDMMDVLGPQESNNLIPLDFALSPGSDSTSSDLKDSCFDLLGIVDPELQLKQSDILLNNYLNIDIEIENGAAEGALEGSGEFESTETSHEYLTDTILSNESGSKSKRAYQCQGCRQTFTNRKVYGTHMAQIHDTSAFTCERCGATFTRCDNLKTHRKTCEKRRPLQGNKRAADDLSEPQIVTGRSERKRVNIQDLKTPPTSFPPSISTGMPPTPAESPVPISSALVVRPISPCGTIRPKGSLRNISAKVSGSSDTMHQTQNIPYLRTGSGSTEQRHMIQFLSDRVNILETELSNMRERYSRTQREREVWNTLYLNLDKDFHELQNENSDLRSQLIQLRISVQPIDECY